MVTGRISSSNSSVFSCFEELVRRSGLDCFSSVASFDCETPHWGRKAGGKSVSPQIRKHVQRTSPSLPIRAGRPDGVDVKTMHPQGLATTGPIAILKIILRDRDCIKHQQSQPILQYFQSVGA